MPEPVLYMRGFPSRFSEKVSDDKGLVGDLRHLAEIPAEQRAEIREKLGSAKGFLSPKAFRSVVEGITGSTDTATALGRVVHFFSPDDLESLFKSLDEEEAQDPDGFPFKDGLSNEIKSALKDLVQRYPSVDRNKKAESLAAVTGDQLDFLELICDIRPIFDENREQIEGMMPYTRMHIVLTGEDGLPKALNVELSLRQVHALLDKAEKATTKLERLREHILQWNPDGLPDIPLTRQPDNDKP